MTVTVKLPTQLRAAAGGNGEVVVPVDGGTVGTVIEALFDEHGELRERLTDEEIREGIRLLAETAGIFTETAGGVTTATLARLARERRIGADESVVLVITGDGLKTLDAVRDTFEAHEIEPSFDAFVEQVEKAPVTA